MMVMTAKVDIKKIIVVLAVIAVLLIGIIALAGEGNTQTAATSTAAVTGNDDRINFLTELGWEVSTSPTESSQVRIPQNNSDVFERYNSLQLSQGYDLTPYMGKNVMRYVYKVENYPNATEPVYATLLIYKNQIIGGDITDTAAKGLIQGLKKATATTPPASSPGVAHN